MLQTRNARLHSINLVRFIEVFQTNFKYFNKQYSPNNKSYGRNVCLPIKFYDMLSNKKTDTIFFFFL